MVTFRPRHSIVVAAKPLDVEGQDIIDTLPLRLAGASRHLTWQAVYITHDDRTHRVMTDVLNILASHSSTLRKPFAKQTAEMLVDRLGELLGLLESQCSIGSDMEAVRDAGYHLADVRTCLRDVCDG